MGWAHSIAVRTGSRERKGDGRRIGIQ
uniref:Uncharacterized protein n=1 Tax=Anguilla anguilla TaxID=7936 RepID=A0A0E9XK92_ANGAN